MNSPIVYTALMGRYHRLVEQPIAATSGARFVCFTDDPDLRSETWEIVNVEPLFPWDPTRSARMLKIRPDNDLLKSANESLWIDNRIVLRRDPQDLLDSWLTDDAPMALPIHSYRATVGEEFSKVLVNGFDKAERIREQLHYMNQYAPQVLQERPYWTAILARRRDPRVDRAMETWHNMVLRHSRRDQLSVNYAFAKHKLAPNGIPLDNFGSEWHEWLGHDAAPKDANILFDAGYRYTVPRHAMDRLRVNKVARFVDRMIP